MADRHARYISEMYVSKSREMATELAMTEKSGKNRCYFSERAGRHLARGRAAQ